MTFLFLLVQSTLHSCFFLYSQHYTFISSCTVNTTFLFLFVQSTLQSSSFLYSQYSFFVYGNITLLFLLVQTLHSCLFLYSQHYIPVPLVQPTLHSSFFLYSQHYIPVPSCTANIIVFSLFVHSALYSSCTDITFFFHSHYITFLFLFVQSTLYSFYFMYSEHYILLLIQSSLLSSFFLYSQHDILMSCIVNITFLFLFM